VSKLPIIDAKTMEKYYPSLDVEGQINRRGRPQSPAGVHLRPHAPRDGSAPLYLT